MAFRYGGPTFFHRQACNVLTLILQRRATSVSVRWYTNNDAAGEGMRSCADTGGCCDARRLSGAKPGGQTVTMSVPTTNAWCWQRSPTVGVQ